MFSDFLGDFSDDLIVNKDLQFKLELISWLPRLYNLPQQGKVEAYSEILKEINTTKNISPESLSKEAKDFFNHLKKQVSVVLKFYHSVLSRQTK